jgi:hypothetical protein
MRIDFPFVISHISRSFWAYTLDRARERLELLSLRILVICVVIDEGRGALVHGKIAARSMHI